MENGKNERRVGMMNEGSALIWFLVSGCDLFKEVKSVLLGGRVRTYRQTVSSRTIYGTVRTYRYYSGKRNTVSYVTTELPLNDL
jgi:hypothetical protein